MNRILVFSDSHGRTENIRKVIDYIPEVGTVLFLGDCLRDIYPVEKSYPNIPFHYVPGNNDFSSTVPKEKTLEIDGVRIYMTHGHQYQVKLGYEDMFYRTEEKKCGIGLFGHTHQPLKLKQEDIMLFNPGSISLPYRGSPSYGIIEIENGELSADILYI